MGFNIHSELSNWLEAITYLKILLLIIPGYGAEQSSYAWASYQRQDFTAFFRLPRCSNIQARLSKSLGRNSHLEIVITLPCSCGLLLIF
jgi:hypothetical protein